VALGGRQGNLTSPDHVSDTRALVDQGGHATALGQEMLPFGPLLAPSAMPHTLPMSCSHHCRSMLRLALRFAEPETALKWFVNLPPPLRKREHA